MFDEKHVAAAIARVRTSSTKDLKALRQTALQRGLSNLVEACDAELEGRPFDYSREVAADFADMASQVADMDLVAAIRHAFTAVRPATAYEVTILRWMAANPGGSYQEALASYGKGDLSLAIGHLVYDRYGCFRKFVDGGDRQSDVLIDRDLSGKSIRYRLKPEAEGVFRELGII